MPLHGPPHQIPTLDSAGDLPSPVPWTIVQEVCASESVLLLVVAGPGPPRNLA